MQNAPPSTEPASAVPAAGEPVAPEAPAAATPRRDTPAEIGGPQGPEPTRYGDWERRGRCIDF